MRTRYLPDVIDAFDGYVLSEQELGAALSFHWNTGGIGSAFWVQSVKRGEREKAYEQFMSWTSGGLLTERRERERELFFNGIWHGRTTVTEWGLYSNKTVNWSDATPVDISHLLEQPEPKWPRTFNSEQDMLDFIAKEID